MSDGDDRRVRFYLGKPGTGNVTKSEVGEFIKSEMGLVRSDDGPKWSDGLTTLINLGMDAWRANQVDRANLLAPSRVEKIEERNRKLKDKVGQLRLELARTDQDSGKIDAAQRVQKIESDILRVLCSDENIGAKSPNFVSIGEVATETGHDYDTVEHYARQLQKTEFGAYVEFDRMDNNIKAQRQSAYQEHREAAGIEVSKDE